jgi:hypothetical protein
MRPARLEKEKMSNNDKSSNEQEPSKGQVKMKSGLFQKLVESIEEAGKIQKGMFRKSSAFFMICSTADVIFMRNVLRVKRAARVDINQFV